MSARLADNKMFIVLALAALAVLAASAASVVMGDDGPAGLTAPNSSVGVKGFVDWEIRDANGNFISGGHSNEIIEAGLDNALKFVVGNTVGGAPAAYNNIAVLQTAGDNDDFTDYAAMVIADDADIDGVRVRPATSASAPGAGTGDFAGFRTITVTSTPFMAEDDNITIDAIVLTSASGDSKPGASTVFAFNSNGGAGWSIPTAGSTITFNWTVGIQED